jgi:hypothetical protein
MHERGITHLHDRPGDRETECTAKVSHKANKVRIPDNKLRSLLTYLRKDVTTAMSRRSTPAWMAIRDGCSVFPTPTPVKSP